MKNYFGYDIREDDYEFIADMEAQIESWSGFVISSPYYGISLDPVGKYIEIWNSNELIGKYASIKDLLLNFIVNGKKLIEVIQDFDFSV